jgi:hypothetical protein
MILFIGAVIMIIITIIWASVGETLNWVNYNDDSNTDVKVTHYCLKKKNSYSSGWRSKCFKRRDI